MSLSLPLLRRRLANHRARSAASPKARRAAVLVPLTGREDELQLLCFRRTDHVLEHAGEICFPGGSLELQDEGSVAAALREAHEEIGLSPRQVEVLGTLDDVETVVSNYIITPVVGYVRGPIRVTLDTLEVAELITVPIERLTQPGVETEQWLEYQGTGKLRYAYEFDGHRIWGATGRILRSLMDLWRTELSNA